VFVHDFSKLLERNQGHFFKCLFALLLPDNPGFVSYDDQGLMDVDFIADATFLRVQVKLVVVCDAQTLAQKVFR
jgi:hypothetical protein